MTSDVLGRSTRDRIPAHLRGYVVEQDYDAYTAVDHEVWRFVLLQLRRHLAETAHPAYLDGLGQTGISIERIPRIAEMDTCLQRYGWGAIGVDGFIPPRAFQEFQALALLPIAVEIRTVEHLPYTPAPDIIHEAAGHAPILPDPAYASFLQRIGRVGTRAFASRYDDELYRAVHDLSVVKERRDATASEVTAAEERIETLVRDPPAPSEAARLARLYWWTVEYGLLGAPADYRIYGAGLLSSLGESHFCRRPEVRKIPLDASCVGVSYDITRLQPQLFVARDFERLGEVLDEVTAEFAFRRGGLHGLEIARESGEVATVELDSGLQVTGKLADVTRAGGRAELRFEDRCLVRQPLQATSDALASEVHTAGYSLALERGGEEVTSVFAGAADPGYWPAKEFPRTRAPARSEPTRSRRALIDMYASARGARESGDGALSRHEEMHAALRRDHPHEWLLRWTLLEAVQRVPGSDAMSAQLARELRALEKHYAGEHPIATGLRHLGYDP